MGKAFIVCGGDFSLSLLERAGSRDFLIAADGGYEYLARAGITPDAVIGDFDSLGYIPEGATVLPVRKDDTDLLAAVKLSLERGMKDIRIFGALGGSRFSHSLSAVQTLGYLAANGATGAVIDEKCVIRPLCNGKMTFPAESRGLISVFALSGKPKVTLCGLSYKLDGFILSPEYPLGVSNSFTGEEAFAEVSGGTVIIVTEP